MLFIIDKMKSFGKMTLSIADQTYEKDGHTVTSTVAYLELAIDRFFTEFSKVECPIGIFKDLELVNISLGTEDQYVVYSIYSKDFSLDFEEVSKMLEENKAKERK